MREKIQVWQENGRVLIRSRFSAEYDLVSELYHKTDENAWLITPDMPITDYNKGRLIHQGPDDFPASFLGEYGTLSGNHASSFARKLLVFSHNMNEKDLGKVFTDEAGNEFCLMEIWDEDNLLIHPLAKGTAPKPDFAVFQGEKLFFQDRTIPVIACSNVQLYPSNRIVKRAFLVDGKNPLEEKLLTECTFLDYVFNYDVVMPEALVDMVMNSAGKAHFPKFTSLRTMVDLEAHDGDRAYDIYRSLPSLLSYQVTMRYEAGGACVTSRHTEVKQPLTSLEALDVMYIWSGECAEMPIQEFYIPKSKPFTLTAADGSSCQLDFSHAAEFDKNFPACCKMPQDAAVSPDRQPERFIRLSGDENGRKLGVAIGYSLINGLSSMPDWSEIRPDIYGFYPTWKMYPRICKLKDLAAGRQIDTVSYRQYFDPSAEPDTVACFAHHENDDLVIYMDFQQKLSGRKVVLPAECRGCTMEIVEKSPDLEIISETGKLILNSTSSFSGCVLRFFAE